MAFDNNVEVVDDDLRLEFDGELLVPQFNLQAYRHIFALETWARRICLAAWMSEGGEDWADQIDQQLRHALDRRVKQNRNRLYLAAETHDDLIWQTTHAELVKLMVARPGAVECLIGYDVEWVVQKLGEVREIRNLLAHNRALSERTSRILAGLLASLEDAVDNFKQQTLYGHLDILDGDDGWLGSWLATLLQDNDWHSFQAFVAKRGPFIEYTTLPVERDARWPDGRLLLKAFEGQMNRIVAFTINKSGDEFSVVTPIALPDEAHAAVCSAFAHNPMVWTVVPFNQQDPRFVCSPKIWFYENSAPVR